MVKTVECVSSEGRTESEPLTSTHEEADTRIILHAIGADSKFTDDDGRIVISHQTQMLCCLYIIFPK